MAVPKKVKIIEVGPRDGFQNIQTWIETSSKIEIIKALLAAGVDGMEVGSFISAKAIPQMRDIEEIIAALKGYADMSKVFALAANKKGVDRAVAIGVSRIAMVISASEAHNLSNVKKTPAESLEALALICQVYPDLHIKLALGTAFGCPFNGAVSKEQLFFVIDGALRQGIRDICLCDTIGVASPLLIEKVLDSVLDKYAAVPINWSLHLHNTRGLAAANTYAALKRGIDCFETSVGGLGGCPFAPGASGNMATEDLVYMLTDMGIEVEADLNKIIAASEMIARQLSICTDSKINRITAHKVFPHK